ncbi:MAG: hypothetical protein HS132_02715 [Planctomycetia bacterium]|nr:hypothetical protein [Planctomycetia bacterium]
MGNEDIRCNPCRGKCVDGLYKIDRTTRCHRRKYLMWEDQKDRVYQIINSIGEVISAPPHKIHIPVFIMSTMAEMLDWLPSFPITKEQIVMLLEGNVCDENHSLNALALHPSALKRAYQIPYGMKCE